MDIASLITSVSIFFSIIWSVQIQLHQDKWQRNVETVHTLEARDRSHIAYINARLKNMENKDSILQTIITDSTLESEVKKQLVIYEDMSIGMNIGIYEKKVVNKFIGASFISFHHKVQPYIQFVRKRSNNPNVYAEFDECVKLLEKLRR